MSHDHMTGSNACWLCDDAPAPSSPAAVTLGCSCPDLFNGTDAQGIDRDDVRVIWAVSSDCPLHARGLPPMEAAP